MRLAAAAIVSLALAGVAHANGRAPGTSSIQFRAGHDQDVLGGMTFGLVISHDGGATWQWMCEAAVGYGGIYDPRYVYSGTGSIVATTFDGLRISRDGCTFATTPLGSAYVSAIAQGPDGALYAAASDPADAAIHKSTDDGTTWPAMASPGQLGDSWESIAVAPSDPTRVYLSGFRSSTQGRTLLLFRSSDGGATFTALPVSGLTASSSSTLAIAAVSPADPDVVFVRVTMVSGNVGDAIYRSTDGGQTFTMVLQAADSLAAFVVRGNGDAIAGTPGSGFFRSTDGGASFQPLTTTPGLHASCLAESSAGALWACTQNFGSEMMGMASSTDGASWTSALRYQDIRQPVACQAGTAQFDTCQTMTWCGLAAQLGITSQAIACGTASDTTPTGADATTRPAKGGCCDAGSDTGGLALAAVVFAFLFRRRGVIA